ncbi:unnamed protein product, partial [Ectocarpus sp. 12 AP-2014]
GLRYTTSRVLLKLRFPQVQCILRTHCCEFDWPCCFRNPISCLRRTILSSKQLKQRLRSIRHRSHYSGIYCTLLSRILVVGHRIKEGATPTHTHTPASKRQEIAPTKTRPAIREN